MDHDAREVIRRRIELRERDGHERLLLNHDALLALLDAADERDRLAAAVERVRALHAPEPFEMPNGEVWYRCGRCQHASNRPCPTLRTLDGTDE